MSSPRLRALHTFGLPVLFLGMLQLTAPPRVSATMDCWIDPGHGNGDTGTQGIDGPGRPNEADITFHMCQVWLQAWLSGDGHD